MAVSKSLDLPFGYQTFDKDWFKEGKVNDFGVTLNGYLSEQNLKQSALTYLYTHHEIFYEEGIIKHTRSSPNWEGGMFTYATCKHRMRSYSRPEGWTGAWLAGLCPGYCESNTLLFVGRIDRQFPSNYHLRQYVMKESRELYKIKMAVSNPRGDLYTPIDTLKIPEFWDHKNYYEPRNHTRSLEFYKSSPGSVSDREDGKIPKWWRDTEYYSHEIHPPVFILDPVWVFSRPLYWTTFKPGRAVLKLTLGELLGSLVSTPQTR